MHYYKNRKLNMFTKTETAFTSEVMERNELTEITRDEYDAISTCPFFRDAKTQLTDTLLDLHNEQCEQF